MVESGKVKGRKDTGDGLFFDLLILLVLGISRFASWSWSFIGWRSMLSTSIGLVVLVVAAQLGSGNILLVALLLLALVECFAFWRGGRLRRLVSSWGVLVPLVLAVVATVRERRAGKAGEAFLIQAGLVPNKVDADGHRITHGAKLYVMKGSDQITGYVPFLPGLDRSKLSDRLCEYARTVGAVSGRIESEEAAGWWVVFDVVARSFPAVVDYPAEVTVTTGAVAVGVNIDGGPVTLRVEESNLLVAGLPGSGKSAFISSLLASLSKLPTVQLYGIDPKIVELSLWSEMFTEVWTNEDQFIPGLQALCDIMDSRYQALAEQGLRKVEVSPETPIIVLVVDELAELLVTGDAKRDKEVTRLLRRLVQKGRAAMICVICATQRPSSDVVPTSLRDLFVQRVAFALANKESAKMILGAAYDTDDSDSADGPWTISASASDKGVGFIMAASQRSPSKFKSFWISDEAVSRFAFSARVQHGEPLLGEAVAGGE